VDPGDVKVITYLTLGILGGIVMLKIVKEINK
jgi:hypothetical protein